MKRKQIAALLAAASLFIALAACSGNTDAVQAGAAETITADSTGDQETNGIITDKEGGNTSEQSTADYVERSDDAFSGENTDDNQQKTSESIDSGSSTSGSSAAGTDSVSTAQTPTAPNAPAEPAEPDVPVAEAPEEETSGSTGEASAVSLSDVWDAMKAQMGELPALTDMTAEDAEAWYGLDASWLEDCVFQMPMMSVHATEFFMARVADGHMDAVKEACLSRQATLSDEWSMYLPAQSELVENYQLVVNGNYILFCVTEYPDTAVSVFDSYTK